MLDILIPVRARPGNVQPLLDSIEANTKVPHRAVFLVHPDDTEELLALYKAGAIYIRSPDHGYAAKINLGASLSKAEFVFCAADDLRFHPDWDTNAIAAYERTGKHVIGTQDGANPVVKRGMHSTHTLVHRDYLAQGTIDEPGKLLCEKYHHQWVDNELIQTAIARDEFVFAADSLVAHNHPIWHTAPMDDTYKIALNKENARADMQLFRQRRKLWA